MKRTRKQWERLYRWFLTINCFGLVGFELLSLWSAYLTLDTDFQALKELREMGHESSYILELFLLEKIDFSAFEFFHWFIDRCITLPGLVYPIIYIALSLEPFWWLEVWTRRVKINIALLEIRLKNIEQATLPQAIGIYFKTNSLGVQSRAIKRIRGWAYQFAPSEEKSPKS